MNKIAVASFIFIFVFIFIASAQIGYNNPNLPRVTSSTTTTVTSTASVGGNVTSVSSTTNCITVNPTTGAVQITFNTSCSGTGNSSWNEAYANTLYRKLGDTINQNNISNFFSNLVTSPIGNATYQPIGISFNQTQFNFIQNLTSYTCGVGSVVRNVSANGTVGCVADASIMRNIFNQDLNTTNNVQFRNISVQNISSSDWIRGKNILLSLAGTAFFPDTTFNVRTADVGGGIVSIPVISFTGGAGLTVGGILDGLYIIPALPTTSSRILLAKEATAQDVWVFENNNNTGALQVFRQNPFAGGMIDGMENFTGSRVISQNLTVDKMMRAGNYSSANGTIGFSGTCTLASITTIRVLNGLVVGCS